MKIGKEIRKKAAELKRLWDQEKIPYLDSAENLQALANIVKARMPNIKRAAKALGIKLN